MPTLTQETQLKISFGLLGSVVTGLVLLLWTVFGLAQDIENNKRVSKENTIALNGLVQSVNMSRINRDILGLQKESRSLELQLLSVKDNPELRAALEDQVTGIGNQIGHKLRVRECVKEGELSVCE